VINSQIGKEYHLPLFLFNLLIPFLILSILFISVCTTVTLVISFIFVVGLFLFSSNYYIVVTSDEMIEMMLKTDSENNVNLT
jgi:hypothetical protein